jgi:hypothetical protein
MCDVRRQRRDQRPRQGLEVAEGLNRRILRMPDIVPSKLYVYGPLKR